MSFISSTNTTLRNSITSSDSDPPTSTTSPSTSLDLGSPRHSLLPSIRNHLTPSGSTFVPPLIRIVTSVSSDSPPSSTACPIAQLSIDALSSSRPRGLRRMSSTGTNLNFFNSSQSNACANALLASPLIGHKRLNPFSLQCTPSTEPIVIGGECGLAGGGTSLFNGRPPSGEKWIAHHLSAVLQHSFSVSSIHPITSVSPTSSPHYLSHQTDLSVIKNSTPLIPADQLRNRSSLTSLSSFAESTTTDDEVDEEVEAQSSTSSTESYLQPSTSILPSCSALDDSESSSCHSTLSSTPRQCISMAMADPESHSPQCVTRTHLLMVLDTWSFDANHLSPTQIRHALHVLLSTYLMYTPGFITKLEEIGVEQPEKCLTSLVDNLEVAYDPRNAYHNFRHAVDVVQAVYTMLSHQGVVPPLDWVRRHEAGEAGQWERSPVGRVGRAMDEITAWALLLAAAGHDVGHPGLSNAFMVNARTPISHVFSDGSVLENFHRITFTRMLRQHGFGKLVDTHAGFRRVIVSSVLATDMGRHFPIVEELKALGKLWEDDESTIEASLDEKALITAGLIKCGDISNSSRPHHISLTWSSCLLHEWSRQAALENDLHLPVSVVTLDPAEKRAQAKSQIGFTTLFVLPLFSVMETLSPIAFQPFANSCRLGLKTWQKVVEHIDAQKPSPPMVAPIIASANDTPADVTPVAPSRLTKDPALISPRHTLTRIPQVSFATYESPPSTSTTSSLSQSHQSSSQSQLPTCSSLLDCKAVDPGRDEDSRHNSYPSDDHLTPRPAQGGWWSSSPSPPFAANSVGQASCTNPQTTIRHTLPPVWSDSASSSPKSSSGSSLPSPSHHITTASLAPLPQSTNPDCDGQDMSTAISASDLTTDSARSRRLLTITVPAAPEASTSRSSSQCVSNSCRKVPLAADDSSFSSIGSPSSPSQSPYFTPGVSSASSVESSNDGGDHLIVTLNTDLSQGPPTAPIRQPPSGLGLRVSDRIMRSRDKGMSVDFGLAERRTLTRSSLSQKKKSYSPYLVNQQVACAKGCGKVTAKCVRCGAASKTKMQRSQSLAKPFLFTSTSSRSPPQKQAEDPTEERKGSTDAQRLPPMAQLMIEPNPSHGSSFDEDHRAPNDASSWPPYPFRPPQSPL